MFDVVALGELLIDFTPGGLSPSQNLLFERNPGGAPANVLTALTRLGGKGAFIGKVGNDQFGQYLKEVLEYNNICTSGLRLSDEANTTLAFVHLDQHGDRSFSFYREHGADTMLKPDEVDYDIINRGKIFHFGSLSMTSEPSKSATLKAVEYAKKQGKLISYDPNWRPSLWLSESKAKQSMSLGLHYTDILKISEEEMEFLIEERDLEKASQRVFDLGIKLIVITLGSKGCYYRYARGSGQVNGYTAKVIDTTGAGDAFLGALLYQLSNVKNTIQELENGDVERIIKFSNIVAALSVTKKGGIPSMPNLNEVMKFQIESKCRY